MTSRRSLNKHDVTWIENGGS